MYKALDRWLPAWLGRERSPRPPLGDTHLLLSICDHFEPFHGAGRPEAVERVKTWLREYPAAFSGFAGSDGSMPRQTFFYPIEQYDPEVLAPLAELCRASSCEVELHLHHDRDSAANLRRALEEGRQRLRSHGLLSTDPSGNVRYGFIHGNWALADSHPSGRHCGVPEELAILSETGCYADFTLPSAPSPTQTRTINSLYYAPAAAGRKSHDRGVPARVHQPGRQGLLLVQGPLGLNWRWRKFGLLPRIENADLTAANPPTLNRLRLWLETHIHVQGRAEWIFAKLHTHGALPANSAMLLGEPMKKFHRDLARFAAETGMRFHYVTAREMVNILHAAEEGLSGDPADYRDLRFRK